MNYRLRIASPLMAFLLVPISGVVANAKAQDDGAIDGRSATMGNSSYGAPKSPQNADPEMGEQATKSRPSSEKARPKGGAQSNAEGGKKQESEMPEHIGAANEEKGAQSKKSASGSSGSGKDSKSGGSEKSSKSSGGSSSKSGSGSGGGSKGGSGGSSGGGSSK